MLWSNVCHVFTTLRQHAVARQNSRQHRIYRHCSQSPSSLQSITMPILQTMKGLLGYGSSTTSTGSTEEPQSLQPERPDRHDPPVMQGQKRDLERPEMEERKRAKVLEQAAMHDIRETASMRERTSMDKSRRTPMRARAYSASAQDITVIKPPVVSGARTPDISQLDGRKKEVTRGRSSSVARREVKPFETPHIVDDRSVERSRNRRDNSVARDRQFQDMAFPSPLKLQSENVGWNTREGERKETGQSEDRTPEKPRKRRDTSVARDRQFQDLLDYSNTLKSQLDKAFESLKEAEKKKIELYNMNNSLQDEKARLLGRESATRRDGMAKEREAKQKIADLLEKNHRQEEEMRVLKERVRYAEEKNTQMSNLLQVRTADLRSAETFLNTADQYSGFEITTMVNTLNAEIFQASAYMAELLEDTSMVAAEDERKRNMAKNVRGLENAHQEIGNGLFAYFLEKGAEVRADPLPLQLALQALFTRWCAFMVHRFSGSGFNAEISRLYERVQHSGAFFACQLRNGLLNNVSQNRKP